MSKSELEKNVNELVDSHFEVQPEMQAIYWFPDEKNKEIRLIEVNPNAIESEKVRVFALRPAGTIKFPVMIADVSPDEWKAINARKLGLPAGWDLEKAKCYPGQDGKKKL